jgi:hypothetical protein
MQQQTTATTHTCNRQHAWWQKLQGNVETKQSEQILSRYYCTQNIWNHKHACSLRTLTSLRCMYPVSAVLTAVSTRPSKPINLPLNTQHRVCAWVGTYLPSPQQCGKRTLWESGHCKNCSWQTPWQQEPWLKVERCTELKTNCRWAGKVGTRSHLSTIPKATWVHITREGYFQSQRPLECAHRQAVSGVFTSKGCLSAHTGRQSIYQGFSHAPIPKAAWAHTQAGRVFYQGFSHAPIPKATWVHYYAASAGIGKTRTHTSNNLGSCGWI